MLENSRLKHRVSLSNIYILPDDQLPGVQVLPLRSETDGEQISKGRCFKVGDKQIVQSLTDDFFTIFANGDPLYTSSDMSKFPLETTDWHSSLYANKSGHTIKLVASAIHEFLAHPEGLGDLFWPEMSVKFPASWKLKSLNIWPNDIMSYEVPIYLSPASGVFLHAFERHMGAHRSVQQEGLLNIEGRNPYEKFNTEYRLRFLDTKKESLISLVHSEGYLVPSYDDRVRLGETANESFDVFYKGQHLDYACIDGGISQKWSDPTKNRLNIDYILYRVGKAELPLARHILNMVAVSDRALEDPTWIPGLDVNFNVDVDHFQQPEKVFIYAFYGQKGSKENGVYAYTYIPEIETTIVWSSEKVDI